ncbi:hypothetical protein QBC35DRAFT_474937 [Podospora australis]|uniref:Uncharacterized protein n=1 Tax=Podospora australis TaxID=1536484 RepID=A0AAN6WV42_9PEZI|nr:hypothetical protein QBC35DRAFT_474937 [Podospora australis]
MYQLLPENGPPSDIFSDPTIYWSTQQALAATSDNSLLPWLEEGISQGYQPPAPAQQDIQQAWVQPNAAASTSTQGNYPTSGMVSPLSGPNTLPPHPPSTFQPYTTTPGNDPSQQSTGVLMPPPSGRHPLPSSRQSTFPPASTLPSQQTTSGTMLLKSGQNTVPARPPNTSQHTPAQSNNPAQPTTNIVMPPPPIPHRPVPPQPGIFQPSPTQPYHSTHQTTSGGTALPSLRPGESATQQPPQQHYIPPQVRRQQFQEPRPQIGRKFIWLVVSEKTSTAVIEEVRLEPIRTLCGFCDCGLSSLVSCRYGSTSH